MTKYAKLGKKAASFADPYTEFTLAGKEVKELTPKQQVAPKIQRAFQGGHLVIATKQEYEEWIEKEGNFKKDVATVKTVEIHKLREANAELAARIAELEEALGKKDPEKTLEEKFSDMNKAELTKYLEDNYQVSEEQVVVFKKKNKDEMVEELLKLEQESSGK